MTQKELAKAYTEKLRLYYLNKNIDALIHKAQEDKPSYLEFIEHILGKELETRDQRDYARRLKAAHLPPRHDLEEFDFNYGEGITKPRMKKLRELV